MGSRARPTHLLVALCLTSLCLLSINVVVPAAAAPATSLIHFDFDFSNSSSFNVDDLNQQGDTQLNGTAGIIEMTHTDNTTFSTGRVTHRLPLRLWEDADEATGAAATVTSFSTRFSFFIDPTDRDRRADGMAFFLAGFPSTIPDFSYGGLLGVYNATGATRAIAVEFDPFHNWQWDPSGTDHVGIDLKSVVSDITRSLPDHSLVGKMTAYIQFDGVTKMLALTLNFDDNATLAPVHISTHADVRTLLPQEVVFGFSATTGSWVERHRILSWSFNSSYSINSTLTSVDKRPDSSTGGTTPRTGRVLAITLPIVGAILALVVLTCFCFWRRTSARKDSSMPFKTPTSKALVRFSLASRSGNCPFLRLTELTNPDEIQSIDSILIPLSTLRIAADNFAERNKLGEGGFGVVYKGVLPEGQEIAIKRLSQGSRQGIEELKAELVLVAKLRHKNLVSLIGVCLEEDEKLLVYEYMPNKSLDTVLFDFEKRKDLDWAKRIKIVNGVARGLQYLHEDSQLRVVHRDLKASNVLLDFDYNPKISDFGLAKLFGWDQTQEVTSHIAGTYGYMAPEYAMRGQYSVKSDAFSFGVMILEIVTGRRNNSFISNSEQSIDLLSLVWEHWTTGSIEELLDPALGGHSASGQMLTLVNIALLCVQDKPADRPTMSAVNVMLGSNTVFATQAPSRPTFCIQEMDGIDTDMYSRGEFQSTSNSKTKAVTWLQPR
uniref:Protein kinase domain-containing protein n=1 Tax=Leersia perrieri TaxID=77586 RepID=A0A0D9WYW7_9ORYZ